MFYPILLSMIAAAPVGVPANAPDPTIRITLNNDGQYLPGDRAKVQVITRDDGYLVVFRVSPEGKLRVLFPLDPTDDNYVKGGKRYLLLGRGGREGFSGGRGWNGSRVRGGVARSVALQRVRAERPLGLCRAQHRHL